MASPDDCRTGVFVGAAYRERFKELAGRIVATSGAEPNEYVLESSHSGTERHEFQSADAGRVLALQIEKASGRVRVVRVSGCAHEAERDLYALLARHMIDRTLQECSEHAVLRLEHELRDPAVTPVAGVIHSEHADPAFARPLRQVRAIYLELLTVTSGQPVLNCEDQPLIDSASWCDLGEDQRLQRLDSILDELAKRSGLEEAQIVTLSKDFQVSVSLAQSLGLRETQRLVRDLEVECRRCLDPRIEIFLVEKADRNRLRSLTR